MQIPDFKDISYLQNGSASQRRAYATLRDAHLMEILAPWTPLLVSTVCLDIDIDSSDLDIICAVSDEAAFKTCLHQNFGEIADFNYRTGVRREQNYCVCSFTLPTFPIEIFAQNIPVDLQTAAKHLRASYRLFELAGRELRERVRELKKKGIKTEPAIAQLLGLCGDPYAEIATLSEESDQTLITLLKNCNFIR